MSSITDMTGWLATLLTIISIVSPTRKHLHFIGILANVAWLIYAFQIQSTPLVITELLVIGLHTFRFFKEMRLNANS